MHRDRIRFPGSQVSPLVLGPSIFWDEGNGAGPGNSNAGTGRFVPPARLLASLMVDHWYPVGHDRHPSAFLVFIFLWRHTHGKGLSSEHFPRRGLACVPNRSRRSSAFNYPRLLGAARGAASPPPFIDTRHGHLAAVLFERRVVSVTFCATAIVGRRVVGVQLGTESEPLW